MCSPYYERNRKGETGYLAKDGVSWSFNVQIDIGIERVTVGVYEGVINNIRHFFLHNAKYFPCVYADYRSGMMTVAFLALMAKCPLEICCKLGIFPSTVVTNDWATGLTAAYAKRGFFGGVFGHSKFMHIVHNLDPSYEGRVFPSHPQEDLGRVHMLPLDLLVDPHWSRVCVNPSRCAILCSDNWGTVSLTYKQELLAESPLSPILRMHASPFAHPNGIPYLNRKARIDGLGCVSHWDAKARLQSKYFPQAGGPSEYTVLLGFVGRITAQKGVHLILDVAEHLFATGESNVQIIVGGMTNSGESYAVHCAGRMRDLNYRFPNNFWSDPDAFFTDGPLLNYGADFGLMPSAFEPGGIVQQEFMIAGTPVVAFKTGGLKDTISEFYEGKGNGFTFESHASYDFANAIGRAIDLCQRDRAMYEKLRANAAASVITSDMVAKAWLGEFFRMHCKVFVEKAHNTSPKKPSPSEHSDGIVSCADSASQSGCGDEVESSDFEQEPFSPAHPVHLEHSVPCLSEQAPQTDEENDEDQPLIKSVRSIVNLMASGDNDYLHSIRVTYKPFVGPHQFRALLPNPTMPNSVLLAGSFDNWASRIPLRWDKAWRLFVVDLRLPKGVWLFKLVVDGVWICVDDFPIEGVHAGNENNVIHIE